MALFKCPKCGEQIETEGNTVPQYCPKCDYLFYLSNNKNSDSSNNQNSITNKNEVSTPNENTDFNSSVARKLSNFNIVILGFGLCACLIAFLGGISTLGGWHPEEGWIIIIFSILIAIILLFNFFIINGFVSIIENIHNIKEILKNK